MATIFRGTGGFAHTDDCACDQANCRPCSARATLGPGKVFDGGAENPNRCLCATHAVRSIGFEYVDFKRSMYYGKRKSDQCKHTNNFMYSSPTTGTFHTKQIVRVFKAALKGRSPPASHRVVYAGTPFKNLDGFRSLNFEFKADPTPNWGGLAHGPGCYVTPSFGMALGYGLSNGKGRCWEEVTLDNGEKHGVAIVLMCCVDENKVRKCSGTAHSHHNDGWDGGKIEWVASNTDVHIYNVLCCYWKIEDPAPA
eukprot:Hpha_TRINITY_DN3560_c0_g1::TRINITY_DN3560_c0_g1_i1::g.25592::m.25592